MIFLWLRASVRVLFLSLTEAQGTRRKNLKGFLCELRASV